ncbi:WD40/YVTN/BNR-like repeat-containing protein [Pseudidiomarina sp. E22-M8]|uniref:WD40/YVTN/BNR-like repeat-containing protein n=1 Tax=Pseudidiomarina sp. E22-M8 TaxID=3424768 RepID=UPI00403C5B97
MATTAAVNLQPLPTRPDVNWIGLSVPSPDVVWISGNKATIARSLDGGQTWNYSQPTNTDLQFRDIEALDEQHAFALSVGKNGNSRIYYTSNGGTSWQLRYRASGEKFLNCFSIAPKTNEVWGFGDSIDGKWDLLRSTDGRNWLSSSNAVDSPPLSAEGGLAASGGCVRYTKGVWAMGTANASTARLLVKSSFGIRFKAIDTPIVAGPSAGIASVWPFTEDHVLLVGGDLNHPERRPRIVEYKDDEFTPLSEPPLTGALYGLTVTSNGALIVTNPSGAALLPTVTSTEWLRLSDANIWSSACHDSVCYFVGKSGYTAKVSLPITPSPQTRD